MMSLQLWQCTNIREKVIQYFGEEDDPTHDSEGEKQASHNRLPPASKQKTKPHLNISESSAVIS